MRYYKILNTDGTPCHGGTGQWSLPTDDGPGDWMPHIEDIHPCVAGYHICQRDDVVYWLGPAIFDVEYRGGLVRHDRKIVVQQARLLRRLPWDDRTARLFACDCAARVLRIVPEPHRATCADTIATARRYAEGDATPTELDEARVAVGAAGGVAAGSAAGSAAWSAARAASATTAGVAVGAAGGVAAESAAWSATKAASAATAGVAERRYQTRRLMHYLHGED